MPSLSLRIDLDPQGRIGPGKIALLEAIATLGSISAAGRSMGMSYRRAWLLVDEINGIFGQPVAIRQIGGRQGGGATLTPLGLAVIARFRAIERAVSEAARIHIAALQSEVMPPRPPDRTGPEVREDPRPARPSPRGRPAAGKRKAPLAKA